MIVEFPPRSASARQIGPLSCELPVTSAPALRKVSMIETVSISSEPFAMGTKTFFAAAMLDVTKKKSDWLAALQGSYSYQAWNGGSIRLMK